MQNDVRLRQVLGIVGAASGLALWGLWKILETGVMSDRTALTFATFVGASLGAHMALSGPLTQKQAGARALILGAFTSLLVTLSALRYEDVSQTQPIAIVFVVILWHLSLPFLISQGLGRGIRHYPTLYAEAWNLFERMVSAWIFAGFTWAIIYLSDLVLGLVGVQIVTTILDLEPAAPMITGAALGLGLAVMLEIGGAVVPALLQRLLRLLLPFVLAVVVLFLVILPFRSVDSVFGVLSAGAIFLVLVALMATMVTAATGPDVGQEVKARPMQIATRLMATLMPIPALLALWALWLRVHQYGWTPERLAAGLLMLIGFVSAALYLFSAWRGLWHVGFRRSNVLVALSGIGLTALWVGVLPTEQISTNAMMTRYLSDGGTAGVIDIYALENWGRPGARALTQLREKADAGDTELATVLDGGMLAADPTPSSELRSKLKVLLPVQPTTATATKDALIDLAGADLLQEWTLACQPKGEPATVPCGAIVGDFLSDSTGEEILFLRKDEWGVLISGYSFGEGGIVVHTVTAANALGYINADPNDDIFSRLMSAPPTLMPAPMNIIPDAGGIMFLPNLEVTSP